MTNYVCMFYGGTSEWINKSNKFSSCRKPICFQKNSHKYANMGIFISFKMAVGIRYYFYDNIWIAFMWFKPNPWSLVSFTANESLRISTHTSKYCLFSYFHRFPVANELVWYYECIFVLIFAPFVSSAS